jgi:hypothetical protein
MAATSTPLTTRGLASVASKLDPSGVVPVSTPSTRRTLKAVPAGTVTDVDLGVSVTGLPAELEELDMLDELPCEPPAFLAG